MIPGPYDLRAYHFEKATCVVVRAGEAREVLAFLDDEVLRLDHVLRAFQPERVDFAFFSRMTIFPDDVEQMMDGLLNMGMRER